MPAAGTVAGAAATIDWRAPWLAPYRVAGEAVSAAVAGGATVADALNRVANDPARTAVHGAPPRLAAGPLRFVPQHVLPRGEAYEAHIARTAQVPTRENLHDLFNGLVWLTWPRLKRWLNEVQAEQIARHGVGATRGAARDTLTVFDENGAVLQAPPALIDDLRERRWTDLFVARRERWAQARVTVFGHALLEQLIVPRKNLTAHTWAVPALPEPGIGTNPTSAPCADAEPILVEQVHAGWLGGKPSLPLPVLGVPGWWPDNEAAAFYRDDEVFRPLNLPDRPHNSTHMTSSSRGQQ